MRVADLFCGVGSLGLEALSRGAAGGVFVEHDTRVAAIIKRNLAAIGPNLGRAVTSVAVVTADGRVYTKGDITSQVSIQSISKVFTMAQVIQEQGLDAIEKRRVATFGF